MQAIRDEQLRTRRSSQPSIALIDVDESDPVVVPGEPRISSFASRIRSTTAQRCRLGLSPMYTMRASGSFARTVRTNCSN